MSDYIETRPKDSNADAWHLFLSEYLDARATSPNGLTFMAVQIAEAIDDAERRGAKDIEVLRSIISKCADALGNGAVISPDCSIEFIGALPSEIGLHVASLTEDRDTWKERAKVAEAERGSLRAKLERAKEAINAARRHVDSQNRAEGMWDGFGPRKSRPSDATLSMVDAVIAELSADAPAQKTQRDLRVLTDTELAERLADLEKRWDDLAASLKESDGCAGSPCEWLAEEMDAVCTEQKRRSQKTQISDDAVDVNYSGA